MESKAQTASNNWRNSRVLLVLSAVLIPPVAAVLLWLRPWPEGSLRHSLAVVNRVAFTCLLAVLSLVYAVRIGFVHVEMAGQGWRPILSLHSPDSDQEALERHRAAQAVQTSAAAPAARDDATAGTEAAPASPTATPTASAPSTSGSAYWTNFRGPRRDGVYDQVVVRTDWPAAGLIPIWRQPIGGGYASFVIANGRAFTIEQRRANETVAAYDLLTGRELWTHSWPAFFTESMGGDGPRATPTWDDGRLYALGATGELHCLDAETGKLLWSKNILSDNGAQNLTWGMAAAPLIVDGKVIVQPGGSSGRSIVAYNKLNGERVWSALDDRQSYTSPMDVTLAGRRQILTVTAENIVGLAVEDGALLWSYPWPTMFDINSAQPIVTDATHVFATAGYDHGAALLEITPGEGGRFSARAVWENRNLKSRFNSAVLHEGYIYGFDENIFACIDLRTGQRKWKAGRYGYGQVLLTSGHLIVTTESGELVLLRATPERHEEIASFSAIEGKTWNHPAMSDGILLVRNLREMAALRLTR